MAMTENRHAAPSRALTLWVCSGPLALLAGAAVAPDNLYRLAPAIYDALARPLHDGSSLRWVEFPTLGCIAWFMAAAQTIMMAGDRIDWRLVTWAGTGLIILVMLSSPILAFLLGGMNMGLSSLVVVGLCGPFLLSILKAVQ